MKERTSGKERLALDRQIVLFIGPEGSGKTTQAKRLAEESGKPYITTGDIIRDLAANDPGPLGDECREMFANHIYLAGSTLLRILIDRFSREDTAEGFVLDGGLRTIEETIDFQKMLEAAGRALPLTIVYLKIPREESHRRLLTGKSSRKRDDDTPQGLENRLAQFYLNLEDRLSEIRRQPTWKLVEIDASPSINEVYEKILQTLA